MKFEIQWLIYGVLIVAVAVAIFWPRNSEDSPLHRRSVITIGTVLAVILGILAIATDHNDRTQQVIIATTEHAKLVAKASAATDRESEVRRELEKAQATLELRTTELQKEVERTKADKAEAAKAVQQVQAALEAALRTVATLKCEPGKCEVTFQDTFLFKPDEATLDCEKKENLAKLVGYLAFQLHLGINKIRVIGHADNTGTVPHNEALSVHRAKAVAGYITGAGIPANIVVSSGVGSSEPAGFDAPQSPGIVGAKNLTPEQRQKNRRVQIFLERS